MADASEVRRQARGDGCCGKELFDVVQSGEVNININETYPLRMCPRRIATLKRARPRFDGAYDLADCRYGAAPR
jgi:hypothetical protein